MYTISIFLQVHRQLLIIARIFEILGSLRRHLVQKCEGEHNSGCHEKRNKQIINIDSALMKGHKIYVTNESCRFNVFTYT